MEEKKEQGSTRRDFLGKALYTAPAIAVLLTTFDSKTAFAKRGDDDDDDDDDNGNDNGPSYSCSFQGVESNGNSSNSSRDSND